MDIVVVIWLIGYFLLFGFLIYQEWSLKKQLSSPTWKWEIAAFSVSLLGLVLRLMVALILPPMANHAYITIPILGMYITIPVNLIHYVTALGPPIATLICFIISRHLLHRDLQKIYHPVGKKRLDKVHRFSVYYWFDRLKRLIQRIK
jgi:putative flippase GtrA